MSFQSLGTTVIKSLRLGEMDPSLPHALLSDDRSRVRHRMEGKHWDYKEGITLEDPYQIAEFAKDILAFHNTDGGLIVVGVADNYVVKGVQPTSIIDTKMIRDKVRRYTGSAVDLFQNSIEVGPNKYIWLVFVPKYKDAPQFSQANAPHKADKPVFSRGSYFYRDNDEVKLCKSDGDVERVFKGFSSEHLSAYNYEIDEPYFRLLNPNCEKFVGRREKIDEIKAKLSLRNPVVCLDGLGGVGKTAIAIQAVRELYDERGKYMFIVSLSAKSKIWLGHVSARKATFAGLHSMLLEIGSVLDIAETQDTMKLKRDIVDFMKDVDGLLVIDNLEEIEDSAVFKFLSEEVPAPSKVLVTSRISKDLGAKTISIPAMTPLEAKDLLESELERLGCPNNREDAEHFQSILEAAGGVPLAIKWAAQIASECKSIRDASARLRGAGGGKQELLSFCFATMYGSLSDCAKDAAKLIPHLDSEWKPMTISVALGLPHEIVRAAIYELSDKGIIYKNSEHLTDDYGVLPLAREFLSSKWHESHSLRQMVTNRFGEMFSSGRSEGFLLDWPVDRRVKTLIELAILETKNSEYLKSLTQVQLAQSWIANGEIDASNIMLRFLQGLNLYKLNRRESGIAHMRQAVIYDSSNEVLSGEDLLIASDALFSRGDQSDEREASRILLVAVQKGGTPRPELLNSFLHCNIRRNDSKQIAMLVGSLRDGELLCLAFDRLEGMLSNQTVAYSHEKEWSSAIGNLMDSSIEPSRKAHYREKFGKIREQYLKNRK